MATKLTKLDKSRIEECHPELQKLWYAVAADKDCPPIVIIDGARTVAEQRANIKRGASKTMRSRHLPASNGWSHATDISPKVNGKISWDWKYYNKLTPHIWRIAKEQGIKGLEWGGNWKSFKDGPHWQLSWKKYPGTKRAVDNVNPDAIYQKAPVRKEGVGNFRVSIPLVLKHEGGYVNHPKDKGGATNMGITIGTYKRYINSKATANDVKKMSKDVAVDIYKQHYWDKVRADMLPAGVDHFVFDYAVNSGTGKAIRALQAVVGADVDGKIGNQTLDAVAAMNTSRIIEALKAQRLEYLTNHESAPTFLKGWTKRVNRVTREAIKMIDKTPAVDVKVEDKQKEAPAPAGKNLIGMIFKLIAFLLGGKTEK